MQKTTSAAANPEIDRALTAMNVDKPLSKQLSLDTQVKMLCLYLIRHADADEKSKVLKGGKNPEEEILEVHKPRIITGRSNDKLVITDLGKRQAKALGQLFLSEGILFDAVCASPAIRSLQTAYIFCDIQGFDLRKISIKQSLQEMSQGDWEGKSRDQVHWDDEMKRRDMNPLDGKAPKGESLSETGERMIRIANNLLKIGKIPRKKPVVNVAFVSHANAIKSQLICAKMLAVDPSRPQTIEIDNCGFTELKWVYAEKHRGWILGSTNQNMHLRGVGFEPNHVRV